MRPYEGLMSPMNPPAVTILAGAWSTAVIGYLYRLLSCHGADAGLGDRDSNTFACTSELP